MTPRFDVRPIASRERVSTSEWPNFRDHGRTVDRPLLRIAQNLQRKHGKAWASEGKLRRMICEDSGHMPGVTTVARALVRLSKRGLVVQVALAAGEIKPDGQPCDFGTRLVWIPKTARQQIAARAFNAKQDRRIYYRNRIVPFDARKLAAKIAAVDLPSMPTTSIASDLRARAREQLERARREHPELWESGTGTEPVPPVPPKGRAPP